jgi:DNA polymerase-3 subunit epsilon
MPVTLSSREVLVVDCQSTGANPARGHLLEIAWAITSADVDPDECAVESSLIALPEATGIPRRITSITGIDEDQLEDARAPGDVWAELIGDATGVEDSLTVAHFARFEEAFLVDLHHRCGAGPFPLRLICTREIARRILPQLPRHGLRALAGHLGHGLPEHRRAADHVRATVRIWQELCRRLADDGVEDLDGLLALLETPPPKRGGEQRDFPLPLERRRALPDRPGVYRFADPNGRVLYVGKAASLRQRVATYFQPRGYRLDTTLEMLTQTFDVQVSETATRLEAALLEVDEIKRLDPPYNTALRDRGNPRHSAAELFDAMVNAIERPMWLVGNENVPPGIGLSYPEPPDITTLKAGVDLFREVFLKEREPTESMLAALGSVLWWEREKEETEKNEQDEEKEEFCWTPARVARVLARGARHAAHLQRKEIWQRMIGNGTIRWRGREEDERSVVIEGGAVPDRLRVLTTELRRLVADDRLIEVRLAPDVALTAERVRAMLEWV